MGKPVIFWSDCGGLKSGHYGPVTLKLYTQHPPMDKHIDIFSTVTVCFCVSIGL